MAGVLADDCQAVALESELDGAVDLLGDAVLEHFDCLVEPRAGEQTDVDGADQHAVLEVRGLHLGKRLYAQQDVALRAVVEPVVGEVDDVDLSLCLNSVLRSGHNNLASSTDRTPKVYTTTSY